jgi:ATP-dependent Clp protease adapter protein ClpS
VTTPPDRSPHRVHFDPIAGDTPTLTPSRVTPARDPETRKKEVVEPPPMARVWVWNNPTTPAGLVVEVLAAVFRLDEDRAFEIMLASHFGMRAEVGVFPSDIAETLAQRAIGRARQAGDTVLEFTVERA